MTNLTLARVFSGIQPTGVPHIGNYFGALIQWLDIVGRQQVTVKQEKTNKDLTVRVSKTDNSFEPIDQDIFNVIRDEESTITSQPLVIKCAKPIISIVDVHAYTSNRIEFGVPLYSSILDTTAALLAIGLTPNNCIMFKQSDILEHYYLDNVFDNFTTTQRLARMTQYKEKSIDKKIAQSTPNGLLTYPVLQTADILLYKASLVPVGEDQSQHIELARDIAKKFNDVTKSNLFPQPLAILNKSQHARRIKSLRNPAKKMSKSDTDKRSFIEIIDEPDVILEKIKKAITDSESRVYYDPRERPGISNLMRIHHLTTGQSFDEIEKLNVGIESGQYKLRLADILIEKFSPIREEFRQIRADQIYLNEVLKSGCDQAKPIASETVAQVKRLLGSIEP